MTTKTRLTRRLRNHLVTLAVSAIQTPAEDAAVIAAPEPETAL